MALTFPDGQPFATGSQSNVYYEPTPDERKARLILRVVIDGLETQAMVDTGGLYLFCHPTVCDQLELDEAEALSTQTVIFREERVRGALHRVSLTFLAEEGDDFTLQATAFVPEASYEGIPVLPSILGLQGCLDRLRFAFDPTTDTFYFGPPG